MNFIGSPEIVTALALAGQAVVQSLTDTITGADGKPWLQPPQPAPEVLPQNSTGGHSSYRAALRIAAISR